MNGKYAVELSNVGSYCDRYMTDGYNDDYSVDQLFERVASVEHVSGVELVGNWHVSEKNIDSVKAHLKSTGLEMVSIIPDHFASRHWGKGSFASTDKEIRRLAIDETKLMMDFVVELGGDMITLWPGQDGYDYIFTSDYLQERDWLGEGIEECCRYRKDVKISIEYKLKEPRMRCYITNVGTAMLLVQEVNEPNCGITLDFGHSLAALENPAEVVAILKKYGDKLFHVHVNDNYGLWDDDMITGMVHPHEYIEFLYWLKRTGYDGWFSFDQYTYREDGREALQEGVYWLDKMISVANEISDEKVNELFASGRAVDVSKMLRDIVFK